MGKDIALSSNKGDYRNSIDNYTVEMLQWVNRNSIWVYLDVCMNI